MVGTMVEPQLAPDWLTWHVQVTRMALSTKRPLRWPHIFKHIEVHCEFKLARGSHAPAYFWDSHCSKRLVEDEEELAAGPGGGGWPSCGGACWACWGGGCG